MSAITPADGDRCSGRAPGRYGRRVDLRHLRELLVVAEELNISRAAERLYLSQPAVSAHLAALERHLGVRLFHRTGRGLVPTPDGERFVTAVAAVLRGLDSAVAEARTAGRCRQTTFTVGFTDNAAGELLGPLLTGFAAAHPELRVRTRELALADQVTAVARHEVDAAFVRPPLDDDRIELVPFADEPRMLALPPTAAPAAAPTLRLADVADEAWVGISPDVPRSFRDFWTLREERNGDPPRVDVTAASLASYLLHVQLGEGVAVVGTTASRLYAGTGLAFVPLADVAPSVMAVALPRDRAHTHGPALARYACTTVGTVLPLAPSARSVPS
jgi:DNA-binding transcriptional LysR family regulator